MRHGAAVPFVAALATLTLGAGPADAAKVLNVTAHGVDTGARGRHRPALPHDRARAHPRRVR